MFWNTCDYQRLCLYCNSRLGQIYLVCWMCQLLSGASDVRLVERAPQMFSFVLFKNQRGEGLTGTGQLYQCAERPKLNIAFTF